MRICYLINSLDAGGVALPLPQIVGVMQEAGHEVEVIALVSRDGLGRRGLDAAGIPHRTLGGATRRLVAPAARVGVALVESRPDLLWTSLTHATVVGQAVGAALGIPVVSWLHNAWLRPSNRWLLRRTRRWTRHWVADSATVADFGRDALGIDPARISVWPPFQTRPLPVGLRAAGTGRLRLGSLGRLHVNKGYDDLVRALALLRQLRPDLVDRIEVVIGGAGPERDRLTAQARALGVEQLVFAGFVADTRSFLAGLDGYIQPSIREGLCIAAHEALGASLPVIATAIGEMSASVRRSGGGWVVPPRDPQSLAAAIAAWADDPARRASMGRAAGLWIGQHFSAEAFRRRGLAVLDAALDRRPDGVARVDPAASQVSKHIASGA